MNSKTYKKMDRFVNEMNQSVNIVGDMSIYLFNRFRNFVGYLFVTITTVAISFIVAEFIRGFEFEPIMGVDTYYIALFLSLIIGLYIAFYGEEAKIATIKGAIFSSGSNRTWQAAAAFAIIIVLIMVNAKGVQRIADFSLRYMNKELQESVVFKLKEQKMRSHTLLATTNSDFSGQQRVIDNLNSKRARYQKLRDSASKKEAKILDWKIDMLDKKIAKEQEKLYALINRSQKIKQSQIAEADKAAEELITHYKRESSNNKFTIDQYKNIGLIVAIGGEVVDGLLAFLLFMIVKSNPNVNGTPKVQPNTRKITKLKSYDSEDRAKQVMTTDESRQKKSGDFELSKVESKELDDRLFNKIKKVASHLAKESDEFIKVGMNRYLKHPSQRELIRAFAEYGITITPYHISEYFTRMEDEIMFVNQKIGFVYTQIVKRLAA